MGMRTLVPTAVAILFWSQSFSYAEEVATAKAVRGKQPPGSRSPQFKVMKAQIERQTLPAAAKQRAIEAARQLVASTRSRNRVVEDIFGGPITRDTELVVLRTAGKAP